MRIHGQYHVRKFTGGSLKIIWVNLLRKRCFHQEFHFTYSLQDFRVDPRGNPNMLLCFQFLRPGVFSSRFLVKLSMALAKENQTFSPGFFCSSDSTYFRRKSLRTSPRSNSGKIWVCLPIILLRPVVHY
jgi:hypothetical protein